VEREVGSEGGRMARGGSQIRGNEWGQYLEG